MLSWNEVRDAFYRDGSWRDIYVLDTNISHWQAALDVCQSAFPDLSCRRAGIDTPGPVLASDALPMSRRGECGLSIDLGGPIANCFFFCEEQIEFDLDPREIGSQADFDRILKFMHLLADATGLDAILTPESQSEIAILRVRPHDARVEYNPFGGY